MTPTVATNLDGSGSFAEALGRVFLRGPNVLGSAAADATAYILLRNVPLPFAAIRRMASAGRVLSFREEVSGRRGSGQRSRR